MTTSSPWMSTEQCAEHLGVSLRSLYQLVYRNGLPASHVGRRLRFHRMYVDEWVLTGVDPRARQRLQLATGTRG